MTRLITAVAAVSLVAVFATPAMAEKPLFMERVVDDFVVEDPGLATACGLSTVNVDGHVRGVFKFYEGERMFDSVVGNIELTGPDGQGPVIIKFANAHEGTLVSESFDPVAGLVTLVFEDTFRGNPEKWLLPGIGVVAIDAGFVSWTVTVVVDATTDELVSEDFTDVVVHGPHPIFENDFSLSSEQLATVCEALGS